MTEPITQEYENLISDPELQELFLEEAQDLLEQLESRLREWITAPEVTITYEIKRILYTLRGGSRLAAIQSIRNLSHALKTLLDDLTLDLLQSQPEILNLSLLTAKCLAEQIAQVKSGGPVAKFQALLTELESTNAKLEPNKQHSKPDQQYQHKPLQQSPYSCLTINYEHGYQHGTSSTNGYQIVKKLLQEAQLAVPTLPEELAIRLQEHGYWLFSTRQLETDPYFIQHYIDEVDKSPVENYVILSHSGHGMNSYALAYYIVHDALELFLHLGWGGMYSNEDNDREEINQCFAIADEIVARVPTATVLKPGERLRIVCSLYENYWSVISIRDEREETRTHIMVNKFLSMSNSMLVLTAVLQWLIG